MNRLACLWAFLALGCYERLEFGVPKASADTTSSAGNGGAAGQASAGGAAASGAAGSTGAAGSPSAAGSAGAAGLAGASSMRPCAQDTDCVLASLRCDVQSGLCFECVADGDCETRGLARCDGALHRCVQCGVDQDCPSGYACDLSTRACAQRCAQEIQCPATAHGCDDTRLVCIECEAEADDGNDCAVYPDRPYCVVPGNRCAQCRADEDCSAGLRCDAVTGTCVRCRDSRDCLASEACDPASHACVSG